jgi:hypothetical protein
MKVAQNAATTLFQGNNTLLKFSLSTISTVIILVAISHHSALAFGELQDSGVIVTDDISSEETYIITDVDGNIMESSAPILLEQKRVSVSKIGNKKLKLKKNKKVKINKNKKLKLKKNKKLKASKIKKVKSKKQKKTKQKR